MDFGIGDNLTDEWQIKDAFKCGRTEGSFSKRVNF